jgi:uncharacterized membrane protein YedE/YeeE
MKPSVAKSSQPVTARSVLGTLTSALERLRSSLQKSPKPYANPYLAGAILGVVLFASFFITGSGLGASGAINRYLIFAEDLIFPDHVNRTPQLITYAGGDQNPLADWIIFLSIGVVVGGFISALISKRISFETKKGPRISEKTRWVMAFLGGILMGYGARFARGCTSGQGLTGGAVLSVGSWAFLMAVFAGAYSLAYFFRKFWT